MLHGYEKDAPSQKIHPVTPSWELLDMWKRQLHVDFAKLNLREEMEIVQENVCYDCSKAVIQFSKQNRGPDGGFSSC